MTYMKVIIVLFLCVSVYEAKDFIVGTKADNVLINTEKIIYRSIPLIRRDKDYTYIDTKDRLIKVISWDKFLLKK